MIRFVLTCLFYTTVARWGYAEIRLLFPSMMPYVNEGLEKVQIPTHNRWSKADVQYYLGEFGEFLDTVGESIHEVRDSIRENRN